jgi:hypothetical protein
MQVQVRYSTARREGLKKAGSLWSLHLLHSPAQVNLLTLLTVLNLSNKEGAPPVHIVFVVVGHIVVDHEHQVLDIQSASCHCRQAGHIEKRTSMRLRYTSISYNIIVHAPELPHILLTCTNPAAPMAACFDSAALQWLPLSAPTPCTPLTASGHQNVAHVCLVVDNGGLPVALVLAAVQAAGRQGRGDQEAHVRLVIA